MDRRAETGAAALSVSSTIVDVSPFSTNGALVLTKRRTSTATASTRRFSNAYLTLSEVGKECGVGVAVLHELLRARTHARSSTGLFTT
jgi:hypothetical protein